MARFKGFSEGKSHQTPIPEQFFREFLPLVEAVGELKLALYFFWHLDRMEGSFRYLRRVDILNDTDFIHGLDANLTLASQALDDALAQGVAHGIFLVAQAGGQAQEDSIYFLNTPRGRAAVQAVANGDWKPANDAQPPANIRPDAPNIFRLYEEHIGPLTPMIAETLRDAENTYPAQWIEEAIRIAVENNARSWRYVNAVLNRWQTEGRDERKDRQDTEKDRRRYIEGEFADYIEH